MTHTQDQRQRFAGILQTLATIADQLLVPVLAVAVALIIGAILMLLTSWRSTAMSLRKSRTSLRMASMLARMAVYSLTPLLDTDAFVPGLQAPRNSAVARIPAMDKTIRPTAISSLLLNYFLKMARLPARFRAGCQRGMYDRLDDADADRPDI